MYSSFHCIIKYQYTIDVCELTALVVGGPLSNMLSEQVDPIEQWNGLTRSMTSSALCVTV